VFEKLFERSRCVGDGEVLRHTLLKDHNNEMVKEIGAGEDAADVSVLLFAEELRLVVQQVLVDCEVFAVGNGDADGPRAESVKGLAIYWMYTKGGELT
jgi:hypothetical protein